MTVADLIDNDLYVIMLNRKDVENGKAPRYYVVGDTYPYANDPRFASKFTGLQIKLYYSSVLLMAKAMMVVRVGYVIPIEEEDSEQTDKP